MFQLHIKITKPIPLIFTKTIAYAHSSLQPYYLCQKRV